MELKDYWRVIRGWKALIVIGTVLATMVGYGSMRHSASTKPVYEGTALVFVTYVTPPGSPYITTLSVHDETQVLSGHASDSGADKAIRNRYHIDTRQVHKVTTAVDPERPVITVQAFGDSSRAVAIYAEAMARYLAAQESRKVSAETIALLHSLATQTSSARAKWLASQARYYAQCGCLPHQRAPKASVATLARLKANLDILQADYLADESRYLTLRNNPVSPATSAPGRAKKLNTIYPSAVSWLAPAAILGLLFSIGLAALLDYALDVPTPGLTPLARALRRRRSSSTASVESNSVSRSVLGQGDAGNDPSSERALSSNDVAPKPLESNNEHVWLRGRRQSGGSETTGRGVGSGWKPATEQDLGGKGAS